MPISTPPLMMRRHLDDGGYSGRVEHNGRRTRGRRKSITIRAARSKGHFSHLLTTMLLYRIIVTIHRRTSSVLCNIDSKSHPAPPRIQHHTSRQDLTLIDVFPSGFFVFTGFFLYFSRVLCGLSSCLCVDQVDKMREELVVVTRRRLYIYICTLRTWWSGMIVRSSLGDGRAGGVPVAQAE